jgi:hypothetical protein
VPNAIPHHQQPDYDFGAMPLGSSYSSEEEEEDPQQDHLLDLFSVKD